MLGLVHLTTCAVVYLTVAMAAQRVLSARPAAARIVSRTVGGRDDRARRRTDRRAGPRLTREDAHMDAPALFQDLTTAHVADACLRLGITVRCAPPTLRPVWAGIHVVGRARPVRHVGSVDVFLEALGHAAPGDVLVVDNEGRTDEACVGDLVALEVARAGLVGIVIWGLHRDTAQLRAIGLPVLSLGAYPDGPERLDPQAADALAWAWCGPHIVTGDDVVLADDDGVRVPAGRRGRRRWRSSPPGSGTPRSARRSACRPGRRCASRPGSTSTWPPASATE